MPDALQKTYDRLKSAYPDYGLNSTDTQYMQY